MSATDYTANFEGNVKFKIAFDQVDSILREIYKG